MNVRWLLTTARSFSWRTLRATPIVDAFTWPLAHIFGQVNCACARQMTLMFRAIGNQDGAQIRWATTRQRRLTLFHFELAEMRNVEVLQAFFIFVQLKTPFILPQTDRKKENT